MNEFKPRSLLVLGRQPALGLAELESLYGAKHIQPIAGAALLDIEAAEINFQRLGGTIKVAKLLNILPTTRWSELLKYLAETIPKHLSYAPPGTFTLGVSIYGLKLSLSQLNRDLLTLKKQIRGSGRSVRIVPNKSLELNSAQVLHNKLTHKGAWELLFVGDGTRTILAQTLFVQDIAAYAARDRVRPKRDARVGMLPPKLAQIIINLATGQIGYSLLANRISPNTKYEQPPTVILDPFCGTGVILQEALLMGYEVLGSDINLRLIDYSRANLDWLAAKYQIPKAKYRLFDADATNYRWPPFDALASEIYLGRALSSLPNKNRLNRIVNDVNTISQKFLRNLARQTKAGQRLALAVPAWRSPSGQLTHLPLIAKLTSLGYNRLSFEQVANEDLVYFRPQQVVARQLLVLERAKGEVINE